MSRTVRIGNFSGFWGDEPLALTRQLKHADLDYLVGDYLAEVSMSILHKQMIRKPDLGYVPDFLEHLRLAKDFLSQDMPKIVTNAGGKNPIACAQEVQKLMSEIGLKKRVFAVTGDDILPKIHELRTSNDFTNLDSQKSFDEVAEKLVVANVYTSSEGIVKALEKGADIVITGRASDSALTIGPLVHELDWKTNDWNRMAAGMIAGHVLECGAQATGGNFTDWKQITQWENFGFPIVEMSESGDFTVTKAEDTGGLMDTWTVKEQLVYEIAHPKYYMGPEVVADLTTMTIENSGENKVQIKNVTGSPAPETWKVSMAYHNGFKAVGSVVVGGKDALDKSRLIEQIFWERLDLVLEKTATNRIGIDALGMDHKIDNQEVLLQFAAFDNDRKKLEVFSKEVAGLILSGPQGLAASGGRPRIQEVISYWPTLAKRKDIVFEIHEVLDEGSSRKVEELVPVQHDEVFTEPTFTPSGNVPEVDISRPIENGIEAEMVELCLARSGDKGDNANIGVLARNQDIYNFLKNNLSEETVRNWFSHLCKGSATRYDLDNLMAFNFFLTQTLDGGGTYSGRLDPQGKMLAALFLNQKIWVPQTLLENNNSN